MIALDIIVMMVMMMMMMMLNMIANCFLVNF